MKCDTITSDTHIARFGFRLIGTVSKQFLESQDLTVVILGTRRTRYCDDRNSGFDHIKSRGASLTSSARRPRGAPIATATARRRSLQRMVGFSSFLSKNSKYEPPPHRHSTTAPCVSESRPKPLCDIFAGALAIITGRRP